MAILRVEEICDMTPAEREEELEELETELLNQKSVLAAGGARRIRVASANSVAPSRGSRRSSVRKATLADEE